jgi:predicted transcriptional regulator
MTAYSSKPDAERLVQLSNEVSRLAGTLARLSTDPIVSRVMPADGEPARELSAAKVSAILRARRQRAHFFPEELFADPAWDMMLDLLHAELTHRRVAVSSLCAAAAVPPTTALRWLTALVDKGLFVRRQDPLDGRRVFVELTPETSEGLRAYFAQLPEVPAI